MEGSREEEWKEKRGRTLVDVVDGVRLLQALTGDLRGPLVVRVLVELDLLLPVDPLGAEPVHLFSVRARHPPFCAPPAAAQRDKKEGEGEGERRTGRCRGRHAQSVV